MAVVDLSGKYIQGLKEDFSLGSPLKKNAPALSNARLFSIAELPARLLVRPCSHPKRHGCTTSQATGRGCRCITDPLSSPAFHPFAYAHRSV